MTKLLMVSILSIILAQNSFAKQQWEIELEKCEIETRTPKTANINVCLKSINTFKKIATLTNEQKKWLAESYYNAGVIYSGHKNYNKALNMYQIAIEKGECKYQTCNSKLNIGVFYYFGQGVAQNYSKSFKYWKEAANSGNKDANRFMSIMCKDNSWACK